MRSDEAPSDARLTGRGLEDAIQRGSRPSQSSWTFWVLQKKHKISIDNDRLGSERVVVCSVITEYFRLISVVFFLCRSSLEIAILLCCSSMESSHIFSLSLLMLDIRREHAIDSGTLLGLPGIPEV